MRVLRLKLLSGVLFFSAGLVAGLPEHASAQASDITGAIAAPAPAKGSVSSENHADIGKLRQAADAYKRDDIKAGDAVSQTIESAAVRAAAEWVALRASPRSLGFSRIQRFMLANPDLPMQNWLQRKAEDALVLEKARADTVFAFFKDRQPLGPNGKTMLAVASTARGLPAQQLALEAYRDRTLTRDTAEFLAKTFPESITDAEKKLRAHRLILNNQSAEGLRLAATLGPDQAKLAQALVFATKRGEADSILNYVPASMRGHSSYGLIKAQILRRQDKPSEARDAMIAATRKPELLADSDEWWIERRLLARKLLDADDAAGAYRVVAEHTAKAPGRQAEAEFHAGWIALRFLKFPQTAAIHLRASLEIAETPAAKARALYWLGRSEEEGAIGDSASSFAASAAHGATYYGQLAAAHIGREAFELPASYASSEEISRFKASASGQVIHHLLAAQLESFAVPLAIDLGRTTASADIVDAVSQPFLSRGDATTVLTIGKAAVLRELPANQHAFPLFGIPDYTALPGSGDKAMVYAIARQESAFQAKAVSHANARGLMQMLPSTASRTAQRFKVPFSPNRLTDDPAFCAMLGAAHLGELMEETKGSIVMTFASYNAGGGRVREWVEAYGDPRKPGTDIIDWVERIPFQETRNYVQRVMENLQVYRARIGGNRSALLIKSDMESGRKF
ncbi:MAG: lytic transglycosylase domain-containing protein [Beijerinckiaceae bacterium]